MHIYIYAPFVIRWPPLLSRLIQEDSNDENEDEDESIAEKETIFAVGKVPIWSFNILKLIMNLSLFRIIVRLL